MKLRLLEPWRTRVLWASLGLNLFAAAALAAPMVLHRRPPGPPNLEMVVERMARRLPGPDAERFREAMRRDPAWFDSSRRRLNEARDTAMQTVRREPFDPGAVRGALQAMQERLRESSAQFDDRLVAALGSVSPEGRAKIAENVRRGRP